MTRQALPFVALNAFLFGSTLIASRFSVDQLEPIVYIALRFIIASSIWAGIFLFSRGRRFPTDPRLWRRASVLGVFGSAFNNLAIVSALQYQSSGMTSVLVTTAPAVTVLFAHFILPEERLKPRQWAGVLLALGGAVLLSIAGENGLEGVQFDPRGYMLAGLAVLFGASMTVYARRALVGFDDLETASIRMYAATVVTVPLAVLLPGLDFSHLTPVGGAAVVYAGLFGTFGGFFMQLYLITHFGAIPASMPPYLLPIVTGIGGVLLLGETITPVMLLGMAIILSGIALVQQPRRKKLAAT